MKMNDGCRNVLGGGIIAVVLVLLSFVAFAHGEEDTAEAERLVNERVSCDQLTEDQLEGIGDYLMEQMHPGELHELMDERMGGEGSESLHQAHVGMAEHLFCGKSSSFSGGMMGNLGMMGAAGGIGGMGMMNMMMGGGMMGMMGSGMMGGGSTPRLGTSNGMMGNNKQEVSTMMGFGGYGMTGGSVVGWSLYSLIYTALAAFVFGIVFWWTHNLMVKEKKK